MAVKGLREITAVAALLVLNAFFGISEQEVTFIFPAFGEEIFAVINFYTGALAITGVAFGLVLLYRHIKNAPLELPTIPSTLSVVLNYIIFVFVSYLLFTWLITGDLLNLPIPKFKDVIEQNIIAADENTLAFIFLATIFPLGDGTGNLLKTPITIINLGEYKLNFNPPNLNRFVYGLPSVIIITLLHAGAYSYQVDTFNEFYVAMLVAGILFAFLWLTKETFGFGACIATHFSWNAVLISVRGSVF